MITVDYAFYIDVYKGTQSEAEFSRLVVKASAYLDRITYGRLGTVTDPTMLEYAKMACCAVIDTLLLNEQGGGIASESNDGMTVNYVAGISNTKSENQRLREAVGLFLGGTDLLYRGWTDARL